MKKRILLLSNVNSNSPAIRYRLLYPLELLQKEGIISYHYLFFYSKNTEALLNGNNTMQKILHSIIDCICFIFKLLTIINKQYDYIIIKNYVFPFAGELPEKILYKILKTKKVVYDIDDGIYLNRTRKQNRIFSKIRNAAAKVSFWATESEKIFVSNKIILQDLHTKFNISKNKFIEFLSCPYQKQYFDNSNQISPYKNTKNVIFIWLGSPHTQLNLNIFKDFIIKLPSVIKNSQVIIMGATPEFNIFKDLKHVILKKWSLENEIKYMRIAKFGLNPLYNNLFEQRKAAFKVIQYYRAGVIPIVSDVGINKDIVNKYGGYCFNNTNNNQVFDFILESLDNFEQNAVNIYENTWDLSVEQNKAVIKNALSL